MSKESTPGYIAIGVAVLAAIASIVSGLAAKDAQEQVGQLQSETEYTKLLTYRVDTIMNAFKAKSDPIDEQKASVMLLALFSQSNNYAQKIAVVSIGARATNAIPQPNTGGPAARFLELTTEELRESKSANSENASVLAYMRSPAYFDMLASGVTRDYFQDSTPDGYTTAYGDQLILPQYRREMWTGLTAPDAEGWIQIATWSTEGGSRKLVFNYTFDQTPQDIYSPFVLNRARYMRDAPPWVGNYSGREIGVLGRVIGLADEGDCLQPLGKSKTVTVRIGKDDLDAAIDNFASIKFPNEVHHTNFAREAKVGWWRAGSVYLDHLWLQVKRADPSHCSS